MCNCVASLYACDHDGGFLDCGHCSLCALARVIEEEAKRYDAAASPTDLREGCRAIAAAVIAYITGEPEK